MEDFRSAGGVSAWGHGPDIPEVDEGAAPPNDDAVIVERGDLVDVGLIDRCLIGIVEKKDIIGVNTVVAESLDDPFDCVAGAGHV